MYKHSDEIYSVDVQDDIVVSGSKDSKIHVWNMATNQKMFELAHEGIVWCVQIVDKKIAQT